MHQYLQPFIEECMFVKEQAKSFHKRDFYEICQHLKYDFFEAGQTVINEGDQNIPIENQNMYFILKGEVQVCKKIKDQSSFYYKEDKSRDKNKNIQNSNKK